MVLIVGVVRKIDQLLKEIELMLANESGTLDVLWKDLEYARDQLRIFAVIDEAFQECLEVDHGVNGFLSQKV